MTMANLDVITAILEKLQKIVVTAEKKADKEVQQWSRWLIAKRKGEEAPSRQKSKRIRARGGIPVPSSKAHPSLQRTPEKTKSSAPKSPLGLQPLCKYISSHQQRSTNKISIERSNVTVHEDKLADQGCRPEESINHISASTLPTMVASEPQECPELVDRPQECPELADRPPQTTPGEEKRSVTVFKTPQETHKESAAHPVEGIVKVPVEAAELAKEEDEENQNVERKSVQTTPVTAVLELKLGAPEVPLAGKVATHVQDTPSNVHEDVPVNIPETPNTVRSDRGSSLKRVRQWRQRIMQTHGSADRGAGNARLSLHASAAKELAIEMEWAHILQQQKASYSSGKKGHGSDLKSQPTSKLPLPPLKQEEQDAGEMPGRVSYERMNVEMLLPLGAQNTSFQTLCADSEGRDLSGGDRTALGTSAMTELQHGETVSSERPTVKLEWSPLAVEEPAEAAPSVTADIKNILNEFEAIRVGDILPLSDSNDHPGAEPSLHQDGAPERTAGTPELKEELDAAASAHSNEPGAADAEEAERKHMGEGKGEKRCLFPCQEDLQGSSDQLAVDRLQEPEGTWQKSPQSCPLGTRNSGLMGNGTEMLEKGDCQEEGGHVSDARESSDSFQTALEEGQDVDIGAASSHPGKRNGGQSLEVKEEDEDQTAPAVSAVEAVADSRGSNLVTSFTSFLPLVNRAPQEPPPASGKRVVKVKALEAAEAARREEERRLEERRMRKAALAASIEREKAASKGRGKEAGERPVSVKEEPLEIEPPQPSGGASTSGVQEKSAATAIGLQQRARRAVEAKLKMEAERVRKHEEEKRRKEEEWRKKESDLAGKKRQREEAERRAGEEKRRRQEEAARTRREAEERIRAELEEKERRRRAGEEAERERRTAEEEARRQRRIEREREMERRRREEEEAKVARAAEKEAERRRKEELFLKRREWEDDEKRRAEDVKKARLAETHPSDAAPAGPPQPVPAGAVRSALPTYGGPSLLAGASRLHSSNIHTPTKGGFAFAPPPSKDPLKTPTLQPRKGVAAISRESHQGQLAGHARSSSAHPKSPPSVAASVATLAGLSGNGEDSSREDWRANPMKYTTPAIPTWGPISYEISPYKSDSDDDDDSDEESDKPRKPVPLWASKEFLLPQLKAQAKVDPDNIFCFAKTCCLGEIFGKKGSKKKPDFGDRRDSGDWIQDRLTWKEELLYKTEMGYIVDAKVTR